MSCEPDVVIDFGPDAKVNQVYEGVGRANEDLRGETDNTGTKDRGTRKNGVGPASLYRENCTFTSSPYQ